MITDNKLHFANYYESNLTVSIQHNKESLAPFTVSVNSNHLNNYILFTACLLLLLINFCLPQTK